MIIGLIAAVVMQSATTTPTTITPDDTAKPTVTAPVAAPQVKVADNSKKVSCRRQMVTGSNIERRVCKTQAEWDSEAAGAAEFMEQIQHDYSLESTSTYDSIHGRNR